MSASIKIIELELESYQEMEDVCENLIQRLSNFKNRHPEFSYTIEKFYDSNKLIVKNCNLHETVN